MYTTKCRLESLISIWVKLEEWYKLTVLFLKNYSVPSSHDKNRDLMSHEWNLTEQLNSSEKSHIFFMNPWKRYRVNNVEPSATLTISLSTSLSLTTTFFALLCTFPFNFDFFVEEITIRICFSTSVKKSKYVFWGLILKGYK